jgi:holliday junction DNA helicase RuvA
MFASLTGTIERSTTGVLIVDVHGVGYKVECPITVWEQIQDQSEQKLYTSTYIREDRFDIFGFFTVKDKELFELFIAQSGIGPKLGLELISVPKSLFAQAVKDDDATLLKTIKGIGGKTAEKLLLELKSIAEKSPDVLGSDIQTTNSIDSDALAALEGLGYDSKTALAMMQAVPPEATTTEARVEAALKSM